MPLRRPIIVAHRGLHAAVPENSQAAMSAAWSAGFQWAECDVHQSPDGIFLLHDPTLDETTEGSGPIATAVDAGDLRLRLADRTLTAHRLPRLADVVRDMPPAGRLLIEVKALADHARLVRDIGGRDVWVQSFDANHLLMTHCHDRSIPLAFLVDTADALAASLAMRYAAVHLDHAMLDADTHRQLRAAGKSVGVWTVNDAADLRRVVSLGVDAVITDEPARALGIVDELCGPG